ncbi:hypothetical protein KTR66_01910 [Roseococcus sp. SDR]|uniref:hypothetical protein n=1 Tax=Roseococcus sp. SDR TaxID=2835532 RepID=UPI001BCE6E3C|nr:hypothetical protein [Roseococcus sp. SDR]MBS7788729.1 hypothetical protein [Roseococcus sp. SDR]MBV1844043.1 hypothetical protein [Roseococcus sp. SDR]
MRPLLLLLPALLPALVLAPPPAAAQAPMACALNSTYQNLSVRIHLQAANGQDVTPATWKSFLPMMEICNPLQGAASVRYEVTMGFVTPGAVPLIICAVTVSQPSGRALMMVTGGPGAPLQCNIQ